MTTLTRPVSSSPTRSSKTLRISAAVLLGAALVIAVLALVSARSGDDGPPKKQLRSQALGFSLKYGSGWNAVPAAALAEVPTKPVAMLRRADRRGLVTVRQAGSTPVNDPRALATGMRNELTRRFPDFRAVSARVVPLRSGRAFLFTFVRSRSRTVQTIALATIGKRSFQLEGVVSGDAPQVARETADILSSFGP